jgi:CheY-like chemotaxis protein
MSGVVAVMSDLFFAAKINDAAKRMGLSVAIVQDLARALEKIQAGAAMVIVDLNCASARPLELIAQMKSDPATSEIPIVGFVSHVQVDLRQSAADAGCDLVVPRSVFSQDLPAILARFAPVLTQPLTPPPPPAAG